MYEEFKNNKHDCFYLINLEGEDSLVYLDLDWRIVLNWILKK